MLKRLFYFFWQHAFIRFLVVGVLNTLFGYSLFALFIFIHFSRPVALLVSTILGVLFNFRTTGVIVFRNKNFRLLWRFVLLYSIIYVFNLALLEILCRLVKLNPILAQGVSLPLVVCLSFLLMKALVFTQKTQ